MLGFIFGVIAFVVGLGFFGVLFLLAIYKVLNWGVDDTDTTENGD